MDENYLRYDRLVDQALRGVLREALKQIAEYGLEGEHHFYITLDTRHPGLVVPGYLRARYSEEMTIVLQNKFWGLEVQDDFFSVMLTFNGKGEQIIVPFSAVVSFTDPSVKFGLQFHVDLPEDEAEALTEGSEDAGFREVTAPSGNEDEAAGESGETPDSGDGNGDGGDGDEDRDKVVALDAFRKK